MLGNFCFLLSTDSSFSIFFAISKMKSDNAAGPSGIVVEMIKAASDSGATMIRDFASVIICDGKVPADCEQSFIV